MLMVSILKLRASLQVRLSNMLIRIWAISQIIITGYTHITMSDIQNIRMRTMQPQINKKRVMAALLLLPHSAPPWKVM